MCPTVHLCRNDSASTIGTQDPDVEGKGAIEKQIAGKWHIITLQEAIEYVDRELLTDRFHVTHIWRTRSIVQQGHFLS